MARLNVFIDGTWLLVQCAAGQSLANATDRPDERFPLDFSKLNNELVRHVSENAMPCEGIGEAFISTSVFLLPEDFEEWPTRFEDVTTAQIEKTRRSVYAREAFVADAMKAGFGDEAVFRPPIRDYILRKLEAKRYQEKQVDTSVVALLVRAAITKPGDFHALVTGDSDILPAIRVAYPQFTENVFVVTTHPDELNPMHRQTAFSLVDFAFKIPPYFMQNKENAERLIVGQHVHRCEECGRVFVLAKPLPKLTRPRCREHRAK
jgi:uncharacterized LabA/DUF88 family protein